MQEYYTVKEISDRLEISVQATYKRIKQVEKTLNSLNFDFKDFKPTLNQDYKVKKGNKTLYSWYFLEFLKEKDFKPTLNSLNRDFKLFKSTLSQEKNDKTEVQTEESNKTNKDEHHEETINSLEVLQEQLKEKDKQIQNLVEMLKQEQELVKNSQVLLLQAQQKIARLEHKEKDSQQVENTEQSTDEPREKQGFFARLFRRK